VRDSANRLRGVSERNLTKRAARLLSKKISGFMLEGASDHRPPQLCQVFFELKATRLAGSMLCWLGRSPPTPRSTRGCRCKGRGGLTQHVAAARCTVSIQILSAVRICLVYPRMSALGRKATLA